jgi:hypothetical protein
LPTGTQAASANAGVNSNNADSTIAIRFMQP